MPPKTSAPAPPTAKPSTLTIDVGPSQEAGEALTLRQHATSLVVVDKQSHVHALEFIRGAKQVQRKIEEHWSRITRSVDDLKKNLLTLKRQDLEPVEAAIRYASETALMYENAENRRIQEEADRRRIAAQQKADADRAAELKRMEEAALKAEAGSTDLSEREARFCDLIVSGTPPGTAARAVGYKDPDGQSSRLLTTPKITKAIAAKRQAVELRQQAEATRQKPVEVVVQKVESQLGKVAGVSTRKTYACEPDVDLVKLAAAVVAGDVDYTALAPNLVFLNQQATALKETFEQAYPGCRLKVKQGIAG